MYWEFAGLPSQLAWDDSFVAKWFLGPLVAVLICAGCGLAPSDPDANDVGLQYKHGVFKFAVRMCPGERLQSIHVTNRGREPDAHDAWNTSYAPARTGLVIVRLGLNSNGKTSAFKPHGTFDIDYTTAFQNAAHRTNGTFYDIRKIHTLPTGKWLTDDDTIVRSGQLRSRGCSS